MRSSSLSNVRSKPSCQISCNCVWRMERGQHTLCHNFCKFYIQSAIRIRLCSSDAFTDGRKRLMECKRALRICEVCLQVFNNSWDTVVALIGESCNTNRSYARLVGAFIFGCYCLRYNLAMRNLTAVWSSPLNRARELMGKLSYQILAARLWPYTPLKAKIDDGTRWNFASEMPKHYWEVDEFLLMLGMT